MIQNDEMARDEMSALRGKDILLRVDQEERQVTVTGVDYNAYDDKFRLRFLSSCSGQSRGRSIPFDQIDSYKLCQPSQKPDNG
jgi:hypothetical protein